MTALWFWGMPEDQAERHRAALGDLAKELECHGLRCRPVERLHLPMGGAYYRPFLLPPELDVYGGGRLIVTVAVVDVPGGGGAWYLLKEPGGLPVATHSTLDPTAAAQAITTRAPAPTPIPAPAPGSPPGPAPTSASAPAATSDPRLPVASDPDPSGD
ncbi:hypothetical protein ABZU32_18335 [Sphaerisporangium sp. NPDC005288]|uniref:hypothetical protein n=1 Tax=Sphaerisporangium sp. NPDC005288 TaxID=3155114 RepID=UPI0033A55B8C